MGVLPRKLARELRDRLDLERAIETGTYRGAGTVVLASVFPEVVTIELDEGLHRRAAQRFAQRPRITTRQGSSGTELQSLVDAARPTLYWLDAHWSGGVTGGRHDECPLLSELESIAGGHPDDCILIDDARLFVEPPPPPHDPAQWPAIGEIEAAILSARPDHRVAMLHDVVVAVPERAEDLVDRFGRRRPRANPLRRVAARLASR